MPTTKRLGNRLGTRRGTTSQSSPVWCGNRNCYRRRICWNFWKCFNTIVFVYALSRCTLGFIFNNIVLVFEILLRLSDVSVRSDAWGDSSADAFATIRSAQRLTRTPFWHLPIVTKATAASRIGTGFHLLQWRACVIVNGIPDDGALTSSLPTTLQWIIWYEFNMMISWLATNFLDKYENKKSKKSQYVLAWWPRRPGADDAVARTSDLARLFGRRLVGHVANRISHHHVFQDIDAPVPFPCREEKIDQLFEYIQRTIRLSIARLSFDMQVVVYLVIYYVCNYCVGYLTYRVWRPLPHRSSDAKWQGVQSEVRHR
jgi:hypothetical protein